MGAGKNGSWKVRVDVAARVGVEGVCTAVGEGSHREEIGWAVSV